MDIYDAEHAARAACKKMGYKFDQVAKFRGGYVVYFFDTDDEFMWNWVDYIVGIAEGM